jgi:hypothetical protein
MPTPFVIRVEAIERNNHFDLWLTLKGGAAKEDCGIINSLSGNSQSKAHGIFAMPL